MNSPCDNCEKYRDCTEICDKLEAGLPPVVGDNGNAWAQQYSSERDDMRQGEREADIEAMRQRLNDAGLTVTQTIIAEMYYWRGLSQQEIASRLCVNQSNISRPLAKIEAKLRYSRDSQSKRINNPHNRDIPESESDWDAHL